MDVFVVGGGQLLYISTPSCRCPLPEWLGQEQKSTFFAAQMPEKVGTKFHFVLTFWNHLCAGGWWWNTELFHLMVVITVQKLHMCFQHLDGRPCHANLSTEVARLSKLPTYKVIGPAVRADFRRLYPANAKTSTCCPSDDNRTTVTNSVTSARSLWWHVGPYFWPADLTRTANPIITGLYVLKTTVPCLLWLCRQKKGQYCSQAATCLQLNHQPQLTSIFAAS